MLTPVDGCILFFDTQLNIPHFMRLSSIMKMVVPFLFILINNYFPKQLEGFYNLIYCLTGDTFTRRRNIAEALVRVCPDFPVIGIVSHRAIHNFQLRQDIFRIFPFGNITVT